MAQALVSATARLFYRLLKHGRQYFDRGVEFYQERYREQQIATSLGAPRSLACKYFRPPSLVPEGSGF